MSDQVLRMIREREREFSISVVKDKGDGSALQLKTKDGKQIYSIVIEKVDKSQFSREDIVDSINILRYSLYKTKRAGCYLIVTSNGDFGSKSGILPTPVRLGSQVNYYDPEVQFYDSDMLVTENLWTPPDSLTVFRIPHKDPGSFGAGCKKPDCVFRCIKNELVRLGVRLPYKTDYQLKTALGLASSDYIPIEMLDRVETLMECQLYIWRNTFISGCKERTILFESKKGITHIDRRVSMVHTYQMDETTGKYMSHVYTMTPCKTITQSKVDAKMARKQNKDRDLCVMDKEKGLYCVDGKCACPIEDKYTIYKTYHVVNVTDNEAAYPAELKCLRDSDDYCANVFHWLIEQCLMISRACPFVRPQYYGYNLKDTVIGSFSSLCKIDPLQIDPLEAKWLTACKSGGLMYFTEGVSKAWSYDINSYYPSILSNEDFLVPIRPPCFDIISEFDDSLYGLFRCTVDISSAHESCLMLRFNKESNTYDPFTLKQAILAGAKINMIMDGKPNVMYYNRESLLTGKSVFGEYVNSIYPHKKNIRIAKLFLSALWGLLSQKTKKCVFLRSSEQGELLDGQWRLDAINEFENGEYRLDYGDQYTIFKYPWARIAPLLCGYGRARMYSIVKPHYESLLRIHTDGCYFNKPIESPSLVISPAIGCFKLETDGETLMFNGRLRPTPVQ